jgi:hypothetical protein
MPNIASILKEEIRRLAKREIKLATGATKQAVAQYRRDIAKLKRVVQAQQKEIVFLKAQEQKRIGQPPAKEAGELGTVPVGRSCLMTGPPRTPGRPRRGARSRSERRPVRAGVDRRTRGFGRGKPPLDS